MPSCPPRFNPTRFDAGAWVKLAKSAGTKYITITAKHHDGFCMFASQLTNYDIVDATRYRKDPLKALADACHQREYQAFLLLLAAGLAPSRLFPRRQDRTNRRSAEDGDLKRYVAYYQGQIRELCTNYGEIGGIWFDG